jgi:leader peptidase (prepilin peptidase) / N-methyltransferase
MEATAAIAMLAASGAAAGSFFNVVAHRLPRGQSIVRPRSRCPGCSVQIAGYDNIPVVSWVALRGRCRSCGAAISPRYPLIEALTAALFAAVALRADGAAELWSGLALVSMLVVVSAIDLEHRIVPNRILAPAAVVALMVWALLDPGHVPENLAAGLAAGTALLVPALVYPTGMGMGDVKLAAVMGLFLGRFVAPALFVGFAVGATAGVGLILANGASARKHAIPFAPYLAIGGIVAQLFGQEILDWYLGLV